MAATLDALKIQTLEAIREVVAIADDVRAAIRSDAGPVMVWRDRDLTPPETLDLRSPRDYVAWAITETSYHHDDQGLHQTICAPGVVTVTEATWRLISQQNAARHAAAQLGAKLREKMPGDGSYNVVNDWIRANVRIPGRLHRRQSNRLVRLLPEGADKVKYTWHITTTVRTVSPDKAARVLAGNNDADFSYYREQLSDEAYAHVIEGTALLPRASVRVGPKGARKTLMVSSALPMIRTEGQPWPSVQLPPIRRAVKKSSRPPRKLHPAPVVSNKPIYQYRAPQSATSSER